MKAAQKLRAIALDLMLERGMTPEDATPTAVSFDALAQYLDELEARLTERIDDGLADLRERAGLVE